MLIRTLLSLFCLVLLLSAVGCFLIESENKSSSTIPAAVSRECVHEVEIDKQTQDDIEQAFKDSGLNICTKQTDPRPPMGYKYKITTNYKLLGGTCPPGTVEEIDLIKGLVRVSVETIGDKHSLYSQMQSARDEYDKGRSPSINLNHNSPITWQYRQALIRVGDASPPEAIKRLIPNMTRLGATLFPNSRGGDKPQAGILSSYKTFHEMLNAGASCQELFNARNTVKLLDPSSLDSMNNDLRAIQCFTRNSTRMPAIESLQPGNFSVRDYRIYRALIDTSMSVSDEAATRNVARQYGVIPTQAKAIVDKVMQNIFVKKAVKPIRKTRPGIFSEL